LGWFGSQKMRWKYRENILLKKPLAERSRLGSYAGNMGLAERPDISGEIEPWRRE
jgi:hypothetical protein